MRTRVFRRVNKWPAPNGSPSRSRGAAKAGGADRDRTDDLKLAKLALSQLSYGPDSNLIQISAWGGSPSPSRGAARRRLVGPGRFERPTSRLSGVRSNHLSYEPFIGNLKKQKSGVGTRAPGAELSAATSRL